MLTESFVSRTSSKADEPKYDPANEKTTPSLKAACRILAVRFT